MTIKKIVETALNKQINKELFSSYLYLSMSAYFERTNLTGFANWMRVQAEEEILHTMKMYNFVISRGGNINFYAIEKPEQGWKNALEVFKKSLEHEEQITRSINKLYDLALKEKDNATMIMLQWFINEQVEEEANVNEIVEKLKMVGDSQQGLMMIQSEYANRPKPTNLIK